MRRILGSVVLIGVVSAVVFVSSSAFFSDTEIASDNAFEAGSIDLKIANQSYLWKDSSWVYNQDNSWALQDVLPQFKYFSFSDVKPGDLSQDTITLQVNDNSAWVCADIRLTASAENNVIEPETNGGELPLNGDWDGELASELQFVIWADDGDHTLEIDEEVVLQGSADQLPQGLGNTGVRLPVIDSLHNPWSSVGEPLSPGESGRVWIGKAWCFGDITLVPQPEGNGISQQRPPSILCNGAAVSNNSQTDSVAGEISFSAIQSRNNRDYVCSDLDQDQPVLIFEDDFNDGNTDGWWLGFSHHTPWQLGNWRIENNQLTQDEGGDDYIALVDGYDLGNQVVLSLVNFNQVSGYGGITIWYQDSDNWTNIVMYPAASFLSVHERIGGVSSVTDHPFISVNEVWYEMKVDANSTTGEVKVFIDNIQEISHFVSTSVKFGKSGLNTGNSGAFFDDFKLYSY